MHSGDSRGASIEEQLGQRVIDGQHPKRHAINKIQSEQEAHQPEVGVRGGGEEILDHNGALIADEPPLGVDGAVAGESRFGTGLAVHRDVGRAREGFGA
ncbi:Uncharacterised protein [Mycobacterium tuberculosis]|nr:Uncharacterised protein [Mycobacterium tuberculosis]